jgi:putative endopeptidase
MERAGADEARKLSDFWITAVDEARAARLGLQPLRTELARIDRSASRNQVIDAAFALVPLDINILFGLDVVPEPRDSQVNAIQLMQACLGLPNRDFYLNDSPSLAQIRKR